MKNGKDKIGRREFITAAGALGAGALFPTSARGRTPPSLPGVAVLEARERDRFRVLAVTDLHFFNGPLHRIKDPRTLKDIGKMIKAFDPDLLMVDGDVWHNNPNGRGVEFCRSACEHLGGLGVPWAFVRGNHDLADDFDECHALLTNAPNSLYRGTAGESCYRIEITNPGGAPLWNIIVINDSAPEMGFRAGRIVWFEDEIGRIKSENDPPPPAFVFCHIPLPQFADLIADGEDIGVHHENVCFEGGTRGALMAFKDSGMVRAVFCGHDHVNNYYGDDDGIHLEYVRATGYSGYGGSQVKKGATLINVDAADPGPGFGTLTVFAGARASASTFRQKSLLGAGE